MESAQLVAQWIIHAFHEREDLITNLKLQKLLYYAQGWYLGLNDRPLFADAIQAWIHGPVVPSVYQRYRDYRWNPISEEVTVQRFAPAVETHLEEVLDQYGIETGWLLEMRTHQESPWLLARAGCPHDQNGQAVISHAAMQTYFRCLADAP